MKNKTIFYCSECGYESAKWMGQCPACKSWNTFVEEPVVKAGAKGVRRNQDQKAVRPVMLSDVRAEDEVRISSGIGELDRVLGGGIVKGSLVLVGGDPGIGKSTLLLQMCRALSVTETKTLYVSGEESLHQIKLRADRLGGFGKNLWMISETDLQSIQTTILKYHPQVVIIDSIQTMYSDTVSSGAGSVSQVREATNILMQIAKKENISIFIVGHVTKEGVVAGPRVLEHMVDTVLYFEGDRHASYRILRAVKNRFGSTDELGVFEMGNDGLREVLNPSELMLDGMAGDAAGSAVACIMEGTRPMMIEVQALVCTTNFQIPRRTAAGLDYNRVNLLMAVLEKRLGLHTGNMDAYINLAGGIRMNEPALDLAVVTAVISSYLNKPVSSNTAFFGEVGLTGEVRAVSQAENRIREADKLGFKACCLPEGNLRRLRGSTDLQLTGISNVRDLYSYIRDEKK